MYENKRLNDLGLDKDLDSLLDKDLDSCLDEIQCDAQKEIVNDYVQRFKRKIKNKK